MSVGLSEQHCCSSLSRRVHLHDSSVCLSPSPCARVHDSSVTESSWSRVHDSSITESRPHGVRVHDSSVCSRPRFSPWMTDVQRPWYCLSSPARMFVEVHHNRCEDVSVHFFLIPKDGPRRLPKEGGRKDNLDIKIQFVSRL